ncbi:MAG: type II toxin-antitoxin system PemK/MazF family toxin [archaeon]
MEIKRGDILLVNFEPVRGSEQGKVRPAVVVQNDVFNRFSPLLIVIPLTSKIYTKGYPTNVFVKSEESGLNNDSTILSNQIRTIDKSRVVKKISFLNSELMKKVDMAIKVSLALN